MALLLQDYDLLRKMFSSAPVFPVRADPCEFGIERGEFLQCHKIAEEVHRQLGFKFTMGVAALDLAGKLYPWPHCVNASPMGLLDFSVSPDQRNLGFFCNEAFDVETFNRITSAYTAEPRDQFAARWSDPLAQALSDEFYDRLSTSITR